MGAQWVVWNQRDLSTFYKCSVVAATDERRQGKPIDFVEIHPNMNSIFLI